MEFEKSSLYLEALAIVNDTAKPVHDNWHAQIHVNGQTFDVVRIGTLDVIKDFEQNYTDELMVSTYIPAGTYAKQIYPYRKHIEVTLFRYPLKERAAEADLERVPYTERYMAVLLDQGSPVIAANTPNNPTEFAMNLSNLLEVSFQLIPKAVDQIRMTTIGGVYRKTTVENLVKALLTKESQQLDVDNTFKPLGVDMVPANNQKVRDHFIIPHGTPLTDLPGYLQRKAGGIYSAGAGFYYLRRHWYLYPLYDTSRFNQSVRTLTIVNVPNQRFLGAERTYRHDGTNLVVMATGNTAFRDDSDQAQLQLGNGARFADAHQFMEGFTTSQGNRTVANRGGTVNEVITSARASGYNNVQMGENRITANVYTEYSDLARRNGAMLNLLWENANPDLLFPGIPVKVLYLDGDDVKELSGVLLKAHQVTQVKGNPMFNSRYTTNVGLAIFINRDKIVA